ncbi:TPA: hypothetical protein DIU27_05005 [Candidatus Collierbacteria bacterium]|uniref:Phosphoesterase n=1 Tax=Candidatus Collierbacteria bacterium GW2011_GWB2_44_22 TaxID=1618387 RepID=A0A0G1HWL9_9BACT|nr:MAG: Phosphodiesterase, MJ0936 family [Candidatus Collierbacteria bacterium GW2011_GWA2_44_13]KKT51256.1 MAG: Phosphodiesterase, MJ0936 family [Candidatus Collierbacteria bacterium GW2011_GWB1_44_197]KKT51325.1 MAG: Phosphodiesterase, MJ0936 family [Candidatus Collierbacteria bacterium GW2011_GWB2_44_22]KKT61828.1 MAG: Phosphodiesterase, MJ0936 family [Candidatus Collierbacteria bacterium GW2011_GWD1_44_27]KKT66551.1 MAG: Phosphodiesterase, MJ0936 family [Candidatus Collierbacteria bacterium
MLIGIISDTHDNLQGLKKAIQIFKENKVEMLIHCGDWCSPFTLEFFDREMEGFNIPVKSVIGNNHGDIKRIIVSNHRMKNPIEWPKTVTLKLDIDNKKTIIYHGDDFDILNALIDCQKYDIIFTGHLHRVRNEVVGKTLIINPGSTSFACESEITEEASVAIYNTQTDKAEIIRF